MTNALENVIKKNHSAWVTWDPGDFKVKLKYLSLKGQEQLVDQCQRTEWDKRTRQKTTVMDEEKFKHKLADLVLDWNGMTPNGIKDIAPISSDIDLDMEIPCDPGAKMVALEQFRDFREWVLDTSKELQRYHDEQESEEVKN